MSVGRFLIDFVIVFVVALAAAAGATYLWELIAHGEGTIAWGTAVRLALILGLTYGLLLPWRRGRAGQASRKGE